MLFLFLDPFFLVPLFCFLSAPPFCPFFVDKKALLPLDQIPLDSDFLIGCVCLALSEIPSVCMYLFMYTCWYRYVFYMCVCVACVLCVCLYVCIYIYIYGGLCFCTFIWMNKWYDYSIIIIFQFSFSSWISLLNFSPPPPSHIDILYSPWIQYSLGYICTYVRAQRDRWVQWCCSSCFIQGRCIWCVSAYKCLVWSCIYCWFCGIRFFICIYI